VPIKNRIQALFFEHSNVSLLHMPSPSLNDSLWTIICVFPGWEVLQSLPVPAVAGNVQRTQEHNLQPWFCSWAVIGGQQIRAAGSPIRHPVPAWTCFWHHINWTLSL